MPFDQAAYMRARRARLAAARRCTDCTASLLPEWRDSLCPECRETRRHRTKISERARMRKKPYREKKAASVAASRAKNPAAARQAVYEWRAAMVAAGLCRDCGRADAAPDRKRCLGCADRHSASQRAARAAASRAEARR